MTKDLHTGRYKIDHDSKVGFDKFDPRDIQGSRVRKRMSLKNQRGSRRS